MAKVLILCGPSGCGKSTFAKSIPDAVICSADDHFIDEDGEYVFMTSELGQAHSNCMLKFIGLVCSNRSQTVIVDNTNINMWERQNYISLALAHGHQLEVHSWEVSTVRDIHLCAARNTHGVSLAVIAQMALNFTIMPGVIHKVSQ